MNIKKFAAVILITLLCLTFLFACAEDAQTGGGQEATPPDSIGADDNGAPAEQEAGLIADNVPDYDFGGAAFVLASVDNPNFSTVYVVEELTGEIMNDAIYARTMYINERFNVNLSEFFIWDGDVPARWNREVNAGDTTFHMFTMRVDHAFPLWLNGSLIPWTDIPYIDLTQPWWDQSINSFLTINNVQPMTIGAFNIATYDLAFALLFNQQLVADLGLPVPYDLVRAGEWTMDAMLEMMRAFTSELDERWGYVAHPKMVVPNFTVAAGALMIRKDGDDLPYLAMNEERFLAVWERVYELMWDEGHWWHNAPLDADIPSSSINAFQESRALFMDTSFFEIERLRGMETDFGILPYPKFDAYQERHYGRISYYIPTLVPVTNQQLEMTGAIFEALNAKSYRTVLPTYLDTILMVRNIRDEASAEMLALMFDSFVVDMGDTTLCAIIRDGIIAGMFSSNNRSFASVFERHTARIQRELDRMIDAAIG